MQPPRSEFSGSKPPELGGSIPWSLSERLSAGITFVVGNTRAFAAVGQQGADDRWSTVQFLGTSRVREKTGQGTGGW